MQDCPRILLIGCTGQVGWELMRTLACIGEVIPASICGRFGPRVDLTSSDSIVALFRDTAPNLVVNAAAYTAVDKAENDQDTAHLINAEAPGLIGELASKSGASVVHYSTDFVFSGNSSKPYREDDEPEPSNEYGRSKLEGERALMQSGAGAVVFRTSWLYGVRGHNFLLTMQRLIRERDEVRVVDDQIGSPTWCRMLAEITAQVIAQVARGQIDLADLRGVYHVTSAGETSWYGFARAIWEAAGSTCRLLAIPTSDYPTPARRPPYSVLDNGKLTRTFGLCLPDWRQSLEQCLLDQSEVFGSFKKRSV